MESSDNTVAIVAIAVTGGTAVLAALIATVGAHYRQTKELAHDRRMRDRAELRERVDEAAETAEQLLQAIV